MARRLNETQPLQQRFEKIVKSETTQRRTLTRRVPTRWNSDFAALDSHVMFEKEIRQLIATERSLQGYLLTESQWVLAKCLTEVLVVGHMVCVHGYAYKT